MRPRIEERFFCEASANLLGMIDKQLLDILACPACKKPVQPETARPGEDVQGWLACTGCGLRYPIREGIPVMLVDEAASGGPSND